MMTSNPRHPSLISCQYFDWQPARRSASPSFPSLDERYSACIPLIRKRRRIVAEDPIDEPVEVKPPRKGSGIQKMLLIAVLAIVSSAGGGVVSFFLITRTLNAQAKAADKTDKSLEAEQEKMAALLAKSAVLPLEPFVVNLADADAARYLRIRISLMVDDKSKVKDVTDNQA